MSILVIEPVRALMPSEGDGDIELLLMTTWTPAENSDKYLS
jgi:hypothetical protein